MKRMPIRKGHALPALVTGACAVGIVVSVMSTIDHWAYRAGVANGGGLCAAVTGSDCTTAHASDASEVMGLPISLFAGAFYAGAAVLALLAGLTSRRSRTTIPTPDAFLLAPMVLVGAFASSLAYSIWLASILVESGRWCAFCLILYGVNAVSFLASAYWAWPGIGRPSPRAAFSCIGVMVSVGLVVLAPMALAYNAALSGVGAGAGGPGISTLNDATWNNGMIPDRVPLAGNPNATTTLVEFSDFDCPFCASMHGTVADLLASGGGERMAVRFINYPLDASCNPHVKTTVHKDACRVARAGICARESGLFWRFADLAFTERGRRGRGDLIRMASGLGADPEEFVRCLDSNGTRYALAQDIELARAAGVTATPTTLVNRVRIEGRMTVDQLLETLDRSEVCSCDILAEVCACDRENTPDCSCGMQVVDAAACQ